MRNNVMNVIGP